MQIAIKYCGGCNCTYQRGQAIKKLKNLFPEHNYVVGDENWVYDIWLVVCGCEKMCRNTETGCFGESFCCLFGRGFSEFI